MYRGYQQQTALLTSDTKLTQGFGQNKLAWTTALSHHHLHWFE